MDEQLLRILSEFLCGIEEAVRRAKEELSKYVEKQVEWRVIRAERPCNPEDRAIRWLERKLSEIKQKHADIQFEFLKNSEGLITGLRYKAESEEEAGDIEAPTRWAFEKAGQKPIAGNQGKGG